MTDPRHRALLDIVKKLPSDFAPWGERSREQEREPDCSCGCRWYLRLEPALQLDWGVCRAVPVRTAVTVAQPQPHFSSAACATSTLPVSRMSRELAPTRSS